MRALALAVLVGERELDPVLPGAGPAAENLRDRKEVEHALVRLRGELLQPLGCRLRGAQAGRKDEECGERPDCSLGHSGPPA